MIHPPRHFEPVQTVLLGLLCIHNSQNRDNAPQEYKSWPLPSMRCIIYVLQRLTLNQIRFKRSAYRLRGGVSLVIRYWATPKSRSTLEMGLIGKRLALKLARQLVISPRFSIIIPEFIIMLWSQRFWEDYLFCSQQYACLYRFTVEQDGPLLQVSQTGIRIRT